MVASSPSNSPPGRPAPKWRDVVDDIDRRFAQGEFQAGQKFGTLRTLAERYGVSDITARRVFRELKVCGLIVSRGRRGTFVARRNCPYSVVRCLYADEHAAAVDDIFSSCSLSNFLAGFHRDPLADAYELRPMSMEFCLCNLEAVRGQVLLIAGEALLEVKRERVLIDHDPLNLTSAHATSIVFRALPGMAMEVDRVAVDMHAGICSVVHHLVAQGHRRLAMITGRLSSPWFKPRFEPSLTTVDGADGQVDAHVLQLIHKRVHGIESHSENIVVEPQLIVRASG